MTKSPGVLEAIFNKAMEEGKVPSEWRDANISPLFKRGVNWRRQIIDQYD